MPAVMAIVKITKICVLLYHSWYGHGTSYKTGWVVCALGALFAIAPREETIPMAVFCANIGSSNAGWCVAMESTFRTLGIVLGIVGFYVWWAQTYHPLDSGGHDMPLQNALGSLGHQRFLEGWVYHTRFYALVSYLDCLGILLL